eukprot:TRINITY_DN2903_c0_g1_i1.p1 TRINITY_DN2903_c0_g1~~TRINITY_DN2903_c0_g1_i1.p1  ORF type:complete len:128 (+),score=14.20 TRINITY_DN2903_c0_g1_i1:435-818(+)
MGSLVLWISFLFFFLLITISTVLVVTLFQKYVSNPYMDGRLVCLSAAIDSMNTCTMGPMDGLAVSFSQMQHIILVKKAAFLLCVDGCTFSSFITISTVLVVTLFQNTFRTPTWMGDLFVICCRIACH